MNRRSLLAAGAATLASCAAPAVKLAPSGATLESDVDTVIERSMALGFAPGLGIAVYAPDGRYARGFGVADVGTGEPATADTAFYIASATKSFLGLTLASLHEQRRIDLDATLAGYAPDAHFPAAIRPDEVRLRDLLSHTSGVDNAGIGFRVAYSGQHDPETLWRLLAACQPNADAPHGKFEYTNLGYNIATILTDRKLGVRWQDLLDREIFAPAGMTRSSAVMSRAAAGRWSVAKPHMAGADGRVAPVYLQKTDQTMQSAGGIILSANDALRWLELMIEDGRVGGRQVAPTAAVAATRSPRAAVKDTYEGYSREQYGLGWFLGPYRGDPMLHHFGGFAGFRSHFSYLPGRKLGVAGMVNDSTVAAPVVDAIANYVYDRARDRDEAMRRYEAALTQIVARRDQMVAAISRDRANRAKRPWRLKRPRDAYAGVYESDIFGRVDVTLEGEDIHLRCGVLHSVAEPYTQPESIRVEITPGSGSVVQFEGSGAEPDAAVLQGQRLRKTV